MVKLPEGSDAMEYKFKVGDKVRCTSQGSWIDGQVATVLETDVWGGDEVNGHLLQLNGGRAVVEPECMEMATTVDYRKPSEVQNLIESRNVSAEPTLIPKMPITPFDPRVYTDPAYKLLKSTSRELLSVLEKRQWASEDQRKVYVRWKNAVGAIGEEKTM